MSQHEGFCIPVVEAFHFRVPVLAYAAGAVPETLGSAGVLIHDKKPELVAEIMHELISNPEIRAAILRAQDERLRFLVTERNLRDEIKHHFGRFMGGV
jgi:glycosyltransferase involved in cell wall biosynthesis